MAQLSLPTVTLCAATSVNVDATVAAMRRCTDQVRFGTAILFTDGSVGDLPAGIETVPIGRLKSGRAYSDFMLRELAPHIATDHCLVVQWDGFVLDATRWENGFLDYDYIGAPWPQFDDGYAVGNGGFSLRSRNLLEACRDPRFLADHPEDVAIGRTNRAFLEREYGIRFADTETAGRFAFERSFPRAPAFGFHGIFNLIEIIGEEEFWAIYTGLDDRTTAFADYGPLFRQLGGPGRWKRRARLTLDRARHGTRRG